jgi:hypothetical protein
MFLKNTVIEINECTDWNIFPVCIFSKDSLDSLLNFDRWHTLIILSSSLRHIKIKLKNIIKFISGIQIT